MSVEIRCDCGNWIPFSVNDDVLPVEETCEACNQTWELSARRVVQTRS